MLKSKRLELLEGAELEAYWASRPIVDRGAESLS
jgi:hypothetical protein